MSDVFLKSVFVVSLISLLNNCFLKTERKRKEQRERKKNIDLAQFLLGEIRH